MGILNKGYKPKEENVVKLKIYLAKLNDKKKKL